MIVPRYVGTRGPLRIAVVCCGLIGWLGCAAPGPRAVDSPAAPISEPVPDDAHKEAPLVKTPAPVVLTPRPVQPPSTARVVHLGDSLAGRPIEMHVFGQGRPVIFIFGGIHGSEPGSVYVAERLIELLAAEPAHFAGRTVAIAPNTNPDAYETRRRTNLNRVDLNRNFPASNFKAAHLYGDTPASQPETRAIIHAVKTLQPDAIISLHAITGGRECNNYNGPARPLAELLSRYNGYPVTGDIGYPTPGSFGTWAGHDLQIPTVTLELPRGEHKPLSWQNNREALLAFIRTVEPLDPTHRVSAQ